MWDWESYAISDVYEGDQSNVSLLVGPKAPKGPSEVAGALAFGKRTLRSYLPYYSTPYRIIRSQSLSFERKR